MKLEDQVCPLNEAKELYSLISDIIKNTEYYWVNIGDEWKVINKHDGRYSICLTGGGLLTNINSGIAVPALTVSELGVLLGDLQVLRVTKYGRNFKESYWAISNWGMLLMIYLHCDVEKKENEMRARALIKLINDGEINPNDLKL
jgi:hypothetical protein